ncbi:hypothetical protein SteCoe_16135 [Stentor coeruleus]|uniref:Uncharacterized protein n=1 Tax=Stentor coeruleus TaxID=5963 RepID=A0A1R2C238_9CILI|nr:hypothetical protein SteCoe_16135 [Stentor coeruleus]
MKSQYSNVNPGLLRYQKYAMTLHQAKLKMIQDRQTIGFSNTPTPSYHHSRKYIDEEKKQEISKENKILFKKLLSIADQTSGIPTPKPIEKKPKHLRSSSEITRKYKERKIAFENEQLAKKLIDIKPFIMKKTLDLKFLEYKKLRKMLSKINVAGSKKCSELPRLSFQQNLNVE